MKKTILITGASSGIGRAAATELAKQDNQIIMLCRERQKGELARLEITQKTSNNNVDLMIADLASQNSIRQFVNEFNQKHETLDVLINNAAVNLFSRQLNDAGFEKSFATNHLGPFLLTNLLLDKLKSTQNSRIINVASSAQTELDFNDLMSVKDYNVMKVYSRTKMANVLFSYELARRLDGSGITVNCMHPGVVKTELARDAKGFFKFMVFLFYPFFILPEIAAETLVFLATSEEVKGVSGKYFYKKKQIKSSVKSYDEMASKRLWIISEQLTNLI